MTIEEAVRLHLSRDMTGEQIDDALNLFKKSEDGKPMKGRWTDPEEGYPPTMLIALLMSIRPNAQSVLKGEQRP